METLSTHAAFLIISAVALVGIFILELLFDFRVQRSVAPLEKEIARLKKYAYADPLTGLLNRRGLDVEVTRLVDMLSRQHIHSIACVYVDLNNFKDINDECGHDHGDTVLKTCAQTLQSVTRNEDIASRIGGDEFLLLLVNTADTDVHSIMTRAATKFSRQTGISFSYGVSHSSECTDVKQSDMISVLRTMAEKRMYERKRR